MSVADFAEPGRSSYAAELDEQVRRKGVRPIASVDELRADVFESDEELDELLADLDEFRAPTHGLTLPCQSKIVRRCGRARAAR